MHSILMVVYITLPPLVAAAAMINTWRRRSYKPISGFIMVMFAGMLLGAAFAMLSAFATAGSVRADQAALTGYFAASALFIIRGIDFAIVLFLAWILRLHRIDPALRPLAYSLRFQSAALLRFVLLMLVGLPYLIASVMTYTPKVALKSDPTSQYGFAFQPVSFDATDGTHLSGWWIPARGPARASGGFARGTRTVLVCHGWGANKAKQLKMARYFVPDGYNVLAIDFRGHGE